MSLNLDTGTSNNPTHIFLIFIHNTVLLFLTLEFAQHIIMWVLQIILLLVSIRFYVIKTKAKKKGIKDSEGED